MSSGIDVDVRFDRAAAAQAIRVLNIAIADTEALLRRRRQRKFELNGDWEGPAAQWYEDRFTAVEVVAAVVLQRLRATARTIAANQQEASAEQFRRVAAREERARLQREAEAARQRAEAQRLETARLEAQRKAAEAATNRNASAAPSTSSTTGVAA
jgi:hypothetical protein